MGIHLGGGPGQGDFQILTQPWERGLNPTCKWGLMGSYEVSAQCDNDSLWAQGDHRPLLARLSGFPEVEGLWSLEPKCQSP